MQIHKLDTKLLKGMDKAYSFMTWQIVLLSELHSHSTSFSDPVGASGVIPTISMLQESALNFQYAAPIVETTFWRASTATKVGTSMSQLICWLFLDTNR